MLDAIRNRQTRRIEDPPFAKFLFSDTRVSILWFFLRIWLGLQWFNSGWGKLGNPAWMDTGVALRGFWENAVAIPEAGRPAITFGWYRDFLQSMLDAQAYTWFAKLVTIGEVAVGVALIIGAFVGIAAFFGAFMNWNFMMAGSASSNPLFFVVALLLVLAWKTAGYIGADFFLLQWLGTPWGRGRGDKEDTA